MFRTQNTQTRIYNFKCSCILHKMILIKSFLTGALQDCFKLIYIYLDEGDNVRNCYGCLEMAIQAHLHVGFFKIFFIKRISLNSFMTEAAII